METVGALTRQCAEALEAAGVHFGHGTDNALDEAAWLVLHSIGAPLDGSFSAWDDPVDPAQAGRVHSLLSRRMDTREPLAYLLGEAWFCGLRFEVSRDVLVPRSPLAELISRGFNPWVEAGAVHRVLDLCTGSGCIAIAIAVHLPDAEVMAADICAAALSVARRNVAAHGLEARVQLLESDLFNHLGDWKADLIVTNPPYVPRQRLAELPGEYRAEPELGLVSGTDGLDLPLRILRDSANYLEEQGLLVCEVGESAGRLQAVLPDVPFTWLEFEHGGDGVFTMDRQALLQARGQIEEVMEEHRDVL